MTSTTTPEQLREVAHDAVRGGDHPRAATAFHALLDVAPGDTEALNFLAMAALARGDTRSARQLLQCALDAAPQDSATRKNMGLTLLHQRAPEEAEQVLRAALTDEPTLYPAQLYLGTALEQQSRTREAVAAYLRALTGAQSSGIWLDDSNTPPALRPAVRHAISFVRDRFPAVLDALIEPLSARHGAAAVARVRQCIAGYLGDRSIAPSRADQRPTFLYFPGLPETPIFSRELLPWHEQLEAHTPRLQAELQQVLAEDAPLVPFLGVPPPGEKSTYLGGSSERPQWDGLFFYRHGRRDPEACRRAPNTVAALDSTPIVRIPGHGPEALFSVLGPGSHILPHTGVTNTRVVTHLPLLVPEGCTIRIADQRHDWREGRCVTFDDTFEHEAWNNSDRTRVVLLFDVWNPHLTEVEREAVTELVVAIGELKGDQL
ncbi:hypothetical protein N799_08300 [Lysobacter arseniciresistens ZS79]|uniref:Aspartyl/asparaginy/proline hydroxylase domain-containing protein n=1 Tax=Lysobacter arseniciresistens ZS79 TaxID=913325 RepID=A0A0A0F7U6_9GAMM|nr:aspartyl/asparaginyl beta-hydroxylase domain-containing protein [Lysobacter arseniciresistens]KGM57427.1 hypothetical protein N799_08300 [Lysobacter arseniciresistens ZS79]